MKQPPTANEHPETSLTALSKFLQTQQIMHDCALNAHPATWGEYMSLITQLVAISPYNTESGPRVNAEITATFVYY